MGKNNNIIEINGQRYDANTGVLLSAVAPSAQASTAMPASKSAIAEHAPKHVPAGSNNSSSARSAKSSAARKPAEHSRRHQPTPSKTLMRHAVKKPDPSHKHHRKVQVSTDEIARRSLPKVVIKPPLTKPDEKLLRRANRIPKSQLISHFVPVDDSSFVPAMPNTARPKPSPVPPASVKTKQHPTTVLLEKALAEATAHHQQPVPPHRRRSKRLAGLAGASIIGIAIVIVVGAQNLQGARLQMASAKAGFNASLSDNMPSGFAQHSLNYSSGVVASEFISNSDERRYTITQKRSSWNSASLRTEFVQTFGQQFQTIESEDLTIYIYGQSNATWVKAGIWYVIQSNGALSDRQLIDIATGM